MQNLNENKLIEQVLAMIRKRETPAIPYTHVSCCCFICKAFVKFATAFVKHSLAFIHVHMPIVKLICEDLKTF